LKQSCKRLATIPTGRRPGGELSQYQNQARECKKSVVSLGVLAGAGFIESEIKALMAEFGAEEYSLPPEFAGQVLEFIRWYKGQAASTWSTY
jgi:hypothetical protein